MAMVRPYAVADKPACLAIFDGNVPDFFDATERGDFAKFLDSPGGEYFVMERDGAIIGCGGFAREDGGQAHFTWGMVDSEHHGDGLGRLLAEYRLQEIERSGEYSKVELFTTPKVAPFFARFGFEAREITVDGFAPGLDRVQMIRLMGVDSG